MLKTVWWLPFWFLVKNDKIVYVKRFNVKRICVFHLTIACSLEEYTKTLYPIHIRIIHIRTFPLFRFIVDNVNKHNKVISFTHTRRSFSAGFSLHSKDYKKEWSEHYNDFSDSPVEATQKWLLFNKENEKVLSYIQNKLTMRCIQFISFYSTFYTLFTRGFQSFL